MPANPKKRDPANRFCAQPHQPPVPLQTGIDPGRAYAIRTNATKWVNRTVLHYCFVTNEDWDWPDDQKQVVVDAFKTWHAVGIGLNFVAVAGESDAEILIGRLQDGTSWSFVGTDNLSKRDRGRTMNLGWDLTTPWGKATARHEIGHAIGLVHEHQNPNSGIVWDEEAVYANLTQTNGWDRQKTYDNIIAKLPANSIDGSSWDPTSIMHYPFEPHLLKLPHPYDVTGIGENIELSNTDKLWAMHWYPVATSEAAIEQMSIKALPVMPGAQQDFVFQPQATRDYTIKTVGPADSRIVVFEDRDGEPRHLAAADDAGTDDNAAITTKFVAGRKYHIRVRVAYADGATPIGLMVQ